MERNDIDFVFIDSAGNPWRVCTREATKVYPPTTETKPWIFSWSTYQKWVPLREMNEEDVQQANVFDKMPRWIADLYHKLSEIHM